MPFLAVRGSQGLHLVREKKSSSNVPSWEKAPDDVFKPDESKNCKVFAFNSSGDVFAWSNGLCVQVVSWSASEERWSPSPLQIDASRVSFLAFSPLGSVLATWEIYAVKAGQPNAAPPTNMALWDPKTGRRLGAFVQKKSFGWCPQWTRDERLCCLRGQNNEGSFFRGNNFTEVDKRLSIAKMDSFSLSPGGKGGEAHVACFIPGQKGGPGFGKLFRYPNFNPEKDAVGCKSFFQADRMDTEWSSDGSMALLLTQSEVDKTGGSYYGKQQLHFMSCGGDTAMVQLAKDGPIYSLQWSPVAPEFCVVYGYMPAKATMYNSKCEKIFDFGTGPRNMALYNSHGTILMLGGFGNLRGNIETWSTKDKKLVCQFEAADATDIRWSPGGTLLMTSTCAPRLRQANGWKVFHYTGSLLFEEPLKEAGAELWEVTWQNVPIEQCPPFSVQYKPVEGITPLQPQASKQAYRPPGMRNKPATSTFKLHDEDEPAEGDKKKDAESLSKSAAKNKKRREAAATAKKTSEGAGGKDVETGVGGKSNPVKSAPAPPPVTAATTGSAETDKKLKKLQDKLQQINKLKQLQKEGKQLELNQVEKLKTEADIVKEIQQLKL